MLKLPRKRSSGGVKNLKKNKKTVLQVKSTLEVIVKTALKKNPCPYLKNRFFVKNSQKWGGTLIEKMT